MVKGLYTAYSGLTVQQKRLDVVSNNLANATTTGYKKEGLTTQSFKDVYGIKVKDETVGYINQNIGTLNLGAKVGESFRSWDQGSFQNTGNTFDFALSGSGLFSISFTNKAGETSTLYTRDGSPSGRSCCSTSSRMRAISSPEKRRRRRIPAAISRLALGWP